MSEPAAAVPATPPPPSAPVPRAPQKRAGPHRWRFYRVGGLEQPYLETGEDLARLAELDQKLWVALSCPTRGLELDARTLELLDLDRDGRVRAPEVLAALRWCEERLVDLESLLRGGDALPLADIDAAKPAGHVLLGAARQVLFHLGKPEASAVLPADVADLTRLYERTRFNGDGVVPPETADDPEVRQAIADAIACAGSERDRSGNPGIDRKRLDAFFEDLAKLDAWARAGEAPDVAFLGEATAAAWEAFRTVKEKVDDHFVRCRLAALDPRAAVAMNRSEPELVALAARDLARSRDEVAAFPLARVEPGRPLPLGGPLNPAWAAALAALREKVVAPVLGADKAALTADEWELLSARFLPYQAWLGARPAQAVEPLGVPRVRALLAMGKAPIEALVARDLALEAEEAAIGDVVRMVHYHRDLALLLRNFVSFADFYDPRRPAVFQAGTLYLDGRSCDLCVRVDDPGAHAVLAAHSRMYIAYCDCRRPGGEAMKIAACFTQGDSDYLMVGRNGLFYDRQGRDWDATIVKIVDNPISIRQAFFSPYKKFLRMIEDQVARFAAAKEKASEARLAAGAEAGVGAATGGKPPVPAAVDVGKMVGIVAALGVGAGAIGTLLGGLVSGFVGLEPWWAKAVAVLGVLLVVSGPSMLIAWLKLRQRNIGPVLDANGWAVNGRVKVNVPLGAALTHAAALPPGARRTLDDPYEDRRARTRRRLAWLVVLAVLAGLLLARRAHVWPFAPHAPEAPPPAVSPVVPGR
ncbi:conserved hypothetical protein [Anaeromyxobacter sp. K]|uniref:hypothetical protein n=1 Tax=Anaeromyxobacter sp. (strain K) TaxID=447217 RepID=UPI00015F8964|nr:hypothetical protein [Anaeromyxobacter sp. K]ACG73051.1 conserved hypothetical protein [Anaeromyxobacter sp. K]